VGETVLGRRDRKKLEFHANITECALRLFRARGYEATTVDGICHEMGISKATFFRYFPAKEAVLRDHLSNVMVGIETESMADAKAPSNQLREVFRRLEDFCSSQPEIARAFVVSGVLDPTRHPDVSKRFDPNESVAGRILSKAEEHGEFKCASTVTAVSLMLNSLVYSSIGWWATAGLAAGQKLNLVASIETIIHGACTAH
jgi:TetR/AcrR family transcriptional regulator, cholesterol catabolism regulator